MTYDPATPPAFWTAASVLVGLDGQMQPLITVFELKMGDFHILQT